MLTDTEQGKAEEEERAKLGAQMGDVWDTQELQRDFDVIGFQAPFVVVKRKKDGAKGSLEFQHMPRYYFNFLKG